MTCCMFALGMTSTFWTECICSVLMLAPLLFFSICAAYLWLLLLSAIPGRARVAVLAPNGAGAPAPQGGVSREANPAVPAVASSPTALPRFAVLIPAHNEELVIGDALDSVRALDYPLDLFRIFVIADNCSDRTAEIARAHGAEAHERHNLDAVGKGYALAWMIERLRNGEQNRPLARLSGSDEEPAAPFAFDAIVIIDADTLVAPNLLQVFAAKLAAGECAMQARYEVLNSGESWRTRLMSCALALAHVVKPMGRERLSLSDGLKGNGMCFSRAIAETVAWSGESITEDIDYTIRLCRAGYRVSFAPETVVWAQMPTTGRQSSSQRERWEGGRYRLMFQVAPALLAEAARTRSRILFDRAMELIIPPFAEMFAAPCVLLIVCMVGGQAFHTRAFAASSFVWATILILQAGYLIGGMWMARIPLSVALTALYAPGYIVWKFGLYGAMIAHRSAGVWKRTERRNLVG